MDIGNIAPYMVFGALVFLVVAGLYAQYLTQKGDPAGGELWLKTEWVAHLVRDVEKHMINAPGYDKFDWVFDKLEEYFPDITEREAKILIESQVRQMKAQQPGPATSGSVGTGPIDDRGGELWLSGRQN